METIDLLRSGQLAGTQRLDLAAGLTRFPLEILDLADSLEILNLSNNQLKSLPDEFGKLKKLKIVFLSNNSFEQVPEVLSQCPNLYMVGFKSNQITTISAQALPPSVRWLILTDNRIEQLPASIGQLSKLQKLMLAGNKLRSLPEEMADCLNLELIRLSANQLTQIPSWLLNLPRLSWLAYAGNPFCDSSIDASPGLTRSLLSIDWADLTLENVLGEGASGVIYRGMWAANSNQTVEVAIKIFKGEITSDGLPADEMRACIAAGTHNHLAGVLGKVIHHPENSEGLVFSFIPPHYKNLGNPPDFNTCTRDTYPPGTSLPFPVILRIAKGIAAAALHLHSSGIMHGDLYAHNILVNQAGESLLGDFGAASFYKPHDRVMGQALERLEVRAFGCLLEDLLEHCDLKDPMETQVIDRLRQLQQDCMNQNPSMRPLFKEIYDAL
ncbi:MAG TPA: leucine-rich repeat-containing protein kinase family protein [Trichocoleus sp.]|jgi:hypothetical protein